MTPTDILDLSAISPPRDRARLRTKKNPEGLKPDGSEYELANLEDFTPVQITRFNSGVAEAEALWGKPDLSKAERDRMEQLFTDLAAMVILDAPRPDVAALSTIHRRGVVFRFWSALSEATYTAIGPRALQQMKNMAERVAAGSELS